MKCAAALIAALFCTAAAAPIQNSTISGTITDWPAGKAGEVRLVVRQQMPGAEGGKVLATAAVNEQGQFTLKLPEATALHAALPGASAEWGMPVPCLQSGSEAWCRNVLTLEPAASLNLFELVAYAGDTRLSPVKLASSSSALIAAGLVRTYLAFAPANVTISGDYTVLTGAGPARSEWNADLDAGWNWLSEAVSARDPGTGVWPVKVNASALPDGAVFFLTAQRGQVQLILRPGPRGAAVDSLVPGGAADRAGLKVDDVILSIDGVDMVNKSASLIMAAFDRAPGTTVAVQVRRNGQMLTVPVVLTATPVEGYQH